jgi:hypothetical protein
MTRRGTNGVSVNVYNRYLTNAQFSIVIAFPVIEAIGLGTHIAVEWNRKTKQLILRNAMRGEPYNIASVTSQNRYDLPIFRYDYLPSPLSRTEVPYAIRNDRLYVDLSDFYKEKT